MSKQRLKGCKEGDIHEVMQNPHTLFFFSFIDISSIEAMHKHLISHSQKSSEPHLVLGVYDTATDSLVPKMDHLVTSYISTSSFSFHPNLHHRPTNNPLRICSDAIKLELLRTRPTGTRSQGPKPTQGPDCRPWVDGDLLHELPEFCHWIGS